jgi:hypothetical protein
LIEASLQSNRHDRELLTNSVDELILLMVPNISFNEKIESRKRLLGCGINIRQVEVLTVAADALNEIDDSALLEMRRLGTPIETLIEYISAPSALLPHEAKVGIRETLFSKALAASPSSPSSGEVVTRLSYSGGFLAAISAAPFLISRAGGAFEATAYYVAPLNSFFDHIESLIPVALHAMGMEAASVMAEIGPIGEFIVLGAGMAASIFQWNGALKNRATIRQTLHEPASGVAEELFGQEKRALIDRNYNLLSEGDKHIIAHLSPFEIRVVLSAGPDAAREIFKAKPVPFENQILSLASGSRSSLDFMGQMMGLCLPEFIKAPARALMIRKKVDPSELGTSGGLVKKIYELRGGAAASAAAPAVDSAQTITPVRRLAF